MFCPPTQVNQVGLLFYEKYLFLVAATCFRLAGELSRINQLLILQEGRAIGLDGGEKEGGKRATGRKAKDKASKKGGGAAGGGGISIVELARGPKVAAFLDAMETVLVDEVGNGSGRHGDGSGG